jgi:hypothetical protein
MGKLKGIYLVLLIFVIVLRVFISIKTFSLSPDISTQLHTLVNFTGGKGVTVNVFDNGKIVPFSYRAHAPGLVLFLYLFHFFLNDVILSALLLSITSDVLLILFVFVFGPLLNLSILKQTILYLVCAFIVSPFSTFWPADYLATSFVAWGVYFLFLFSNCNRFKHLLLSVILCTLAYFVKYSFLPFLGLPFLYLLINQLIERRIEIKILLKSSALTILFFIFISFITKILIGKAVQVIDTEYGFYPMNLLKFDSFLFHFGTYDYRIDSFLLKISNGFVNFRLVSILMTLLAVLFLILKFRSIFKLKRSISANDYLITLMLTLLILIVPFLTILSLISAPIKFDDNWTYVQTTRYYGPVILLFNFMLIYNLLIISKKYLGYALLFIFTILHVLAFRSFGINGQYGNDYFTYKQIESILLQEGLFNKLGNETIVIYNGVEKFNSAYYVLNAKGITTVDMQTNKYIIDSTKFKKVQMANLKYKVYINE